MRHLKKLYPLILSLLSPLLFGVAFLASKANSLLFIVLVPLLLIMAHTRRYSYKHPFRTFCSYIYFSLFLWNLITIHWIYNSSPAGALFVICTNALYMSMPLVLYYWTHKKSGCYVGYIALIAYWISMEYFHLFWELSFPFLNLGNGWAHWPQWIQWYEYTGAFGGTLWVLVANIGIYHSCFKANVSQRGIAITITALWVILPISGSYYRYHHYQEKGKMVEAVVVQPNIDSHANKFYDNGKYATPTRRYSTLVALAEKELFPKSQLLIWPESALNQYLEEANLVSDPLVKNLTEFKKSYPQLTLLTGVTTLKRYGRVGATKTAIGKPGNYFDWFNGALCLRHNYAPAVYHKNKLLPAVEYMPFTSFLPISWIIGIKNLIMQIGGIDPSCGQGEGVKVFHCTNTLKLAPVICYDSIYGDYVRRFTRAGATLLAIITNDGWFRSKKMCQQHLGFGRLRAIENRRGVVRCANTGISAFINQRGDILKKTKHLTQATLKGNLCINDTITFYAQHGDYIAILAVGIAIIVFLYNGLKNLDKKLGKLLALSS